MRCFQVRPLSLRGDCVGLTVLLLIAAHSVVVFASAVLDPAATEHVMPETRMRRAGERIDPS